MSFSCKGCPERAPGCHDHCEKYKKEKAEYLARKEQIDAYRAVTHGCNEQRYAAIGKAVKSHGRKFRDNRG